jgi:hypothetical protein
MSAFPVTPPTTHKTFVQNGHGHGHGHGHGDHSHAFTPTIPVGAAASGMGQFLLGAWLWVCGQQIGSLACTGLGYWVVFDAFGVGLGSVLPSWLGFGLGQGEKGKERIRRPYG